MLFPNNDFLSFTLKNPYQALCLNCQVDDFCVVSDMPGVLKIEPRTSSDSKPISMVISTGIHGNETGPMELLNGLLRDILNSFLKPSIRLLVIIGNPHAAIKAQRFCDVNLNRLFSGAYRNYSGLEVNRAIELESCVSDFFNDTPAGHLKLHYDLHTAIRGSRYQKFAVHPFLGDRQYSAEQLSFLCACGIEAMLQSHQPTTTFSYYSYSVHDAHAFTIELGKVNPFGENDLSDFGEIDEGLRHLIVKGVLAKSAQPMKIFQVVDALVKDAASYQLNISDDVENFTEFEAGFVLAESNMSTYRVKQSGDAIVFPNTKLPIGQRAGLVIRRVKNVNVSPDV